MAKNTTPAPAERKPKQRIDPQVKAQLALDVAVRALQKARTRLDDLTEQRNQASEALGPLTAQVEYLAANPHLNGVGTIPLSTEDQHAADAINIPARSASA